jgi:hypothetical protein
MFFQAPRNPTRDLQHKKLPVSQVTTGSIIIQLGNARGMRMYAIRCAHEKYRSSEGYDRNGQGSPALIVVGAHPEPETHHQ